MWRSLLLVLLCGSALGALASDYEREKRWADEVVPGLVVGDAVYIKAATGKEFLALLAEADNSQGAVVIVHGLGMHPDHSIIGVLRAKLTERGYTTLSIQVPIAAAASYRRASARLSAVIRIIRACGNTAKHSAITMPGAP